MLRMLDLNRGGDCMDAGGRAMPGAIAEGAAPTSPTSLGDARKSISAVGPRTDIKISFAIAYPY